MKNSNQRWTVFLALAVISLGVAGASGANGWDEPNAGYTVEYNADDGVWPHDASPFWDWDPFTSDTYGTENSFIMDDSVTGEAALFMREPDPGGWSSYSLNHSGGAGSAEDLMTVDFRFRLLHPGDLDTEEDNPSQFRVAVWRPSADGEASVRFMVTFGVDQVNFAGGASASYPFGTDWHDVRLTIDVGESAFYLYLNGEREPLLAERGIPGQPEERNWVMFGHQGGGVYGETNLAYFRFTNDEIATDPEYPEDLPKLSVYQASELEVGTEPGKQYFIEVSDDGGGQWDSYANFTGTGEPWTDLVSSRYGEVYRAVTPLPTEWPEPSGGFTVAYEATDGVWPYDATPAWGSDPWALFSSDDAFVTTDEFTEEPVLQFNSEPDNHPVFTLDHAGGAGTADDRMTIDFRFRLLNDDLPGTTQLRLAVWRPTEDGESGVRYMLEFEQDAVGFAGGSTSSFPVGTEWHDARLTIDFVEEVGRLFLDGSSLPVLEFEGGTGGQAADRNFVMFGHVGGSVYGGVNLAYLRFTNDQAVEPDPQFDTVAMQAHDAIDLAFSPRAGHSHRLEISDDLDSWEPLFGLPEVEGGYAVDYDATGGVRPDEDSPAWSPADPFRGDSYTSERSFLTTDGITGEDVLYLQSESEDWDSYTLDEDPGAGSGTDLMTIDLRFRFLNESDSFRVAVWRPEPDGADTIRFMVQFYPGEVSVHGTGASTAFGFGTDWNNVRITIDVENSEASFFVNQGVTPILQAPGVHGQPEGRNWIMFGHQGGGIGGELHLAYFRFTNDEIPESSFRFAMEPASGAVGSGGFSFTPTRAVDYLISRDPSNNRRFFRAVER